MDTVHEALTKQRIEEEGKITNWNTLLQNLPVKETIKTGEYQKEIRSSKRWIELVNGDLGQLKDEKLRIENKSQRYDTIFTTHMPLIKKRLSAVVNEYTAIFDQCIANHQAPASYFERSRIHYEWGDAIDCIEDIKTLFEVCPPEYISEELSSKLERSKGFSECEIGLYDEAILKLSNYMKNHPHHERDYLERAIAYFETGQQAGFKTFRRPKGLPRNAVVKISEKNGGMIYIKPGTTNEQCILVRVMPGNPKSPNPAQRKPYVVQRRGDKAVLGGDKLVNYKSPEAHVPLSEFQFKEW